MTNFDSTHFIKSILPNSSTVSLLSYCQCVSFMYTLWVSNNVISYVISPWTFFNFSPYELVIVVVWKICLCLFKIPKFTWINLAYTLWNVFEDSSIELILVMFVVEATWCRLDNHQTSSETQGSNQVCRPLKALSWQLLNCHSHSEFWLVPQVHCFPDKSEWSRSTKFSCVLRVIHEVHLLTMFVLDLFRTVD